MVKRSGDVQNLERKLRMLVCLSFSAAQGVQRNTGDEELASSWWKTAYDALRALESGKLFASCNLLRHLEELTQGHTVQPRIAEIRMRVESAARRARTSLRPTVTALSLE